MKNNLKQFRNDAGLSLQALGDMCRRSKAHIHQLEQQADSNPTLSTAYAIAKVLDKTVYEIWTDTTEITEETIIIRRITQ